MIGGTVNGLGALTVSVAAVGVDTVLARIVVLVEAAQGAKLPVQALVDRITLWFAPVVMAAVALTVVAWLAPGPGAGAAMQAGVAVLIIACPCAMGLAVLVSVLVGSGRAAEMGVLFRRGAAMQALSGVRRAAFDKTGTLTGGRPAVVAVLGDVLAIAAAVPEATGFAARPGYGAAAVVAGEDVQAGAARVFAAVSDALVRAAAEAAAQGQSVRSSRAAGSPRG